MINKFSLVCFLVTTLLFSGCSSGKADMWKQYIPQTIHVGRTLTTNTPWLDIPGGSCGGAFFTLDKSTKTTIQEQGDRFFETATRARSKATRYDWSSSEGDIGVSTRLTLAMQCVSKKNNRNAGSLRHDAGNYFASQTVGNLVIAVFLDTDTVFVGYWD